VLSHHRRLLTGDCYLAQSAVLGNSLRSAGKAPRRDVHHGRAWLAMQSGPGRANPGRGPLSRAAPALCYPGTDGVVSMIPRAPWGCKTRPADSVLRVRDSARCL